MRPLWRARSEARSGAERHARGKVAKNMIRLVSLLAGATKLLTPDATEIISTWQSGGSPGRAGEK
jgi:hypothetical protein